MEHSFSAAMANSASRHMERVFMALSDETRRSILLLLEKRERAVGEIVSQFHLSQPTISRHLSVLREANLVSDERRGQRVIYSLNGDILARSMQYFFGNFQQCRDIFNEKANRESVSSDATSPVAGEPWTRAGGRGTLRQIAAMPVNR